MSPGAVRYEPRRCFHRPLRLCLSATLRRLPPRESLLCAAQGRRCRVATRPGARGCVHAALLVGSPHLLRSKGRTRLCVLIEMLLLPRSAPPVPPARLATRLRSHCRASLLRCAPGTSRARSAPSIFGCCRFDRYVATRFLPDADLHGHRPTVLICMQPLWALCPCFGRLFPRQVHPFLQAMLTTACPLAPHRPLHSLTLSTDTRSEFVDKSTSSVPHVPTRGRCPARHFGWNQLPDSSFGLSPLCPSSAIELNIRIA